ncbi:helix-turn-helix domain-containing protein [Anaerostipes sp.]|uniref:helix-turn-helix domain-containing protein n=1 Tax=Anaerostipes sp. TaxID=1872530 RepID=UPI0025B7B6A7|nr:helix-turn-helix transcriptional regulator [Anaerostipes sp.]MBS7007765.1 helix-turn-helix transcriptional regulator [Anaerostipes sp.]
MKELNIADKLMKKRKEKGVTQDQLAAYIGVSKASVSKWETGQSYPDITFLPQLAAYFNISVDELIGYEPQMTKEDIRRLYHRLAGEFSKRPAEEVFQECEEIVKKYYSCFPLLLQMVVLYFNHYVLLKDPGDQEAVLLKASELCRRVKEESKDVSASSQANTMEASIELVAGRPEKVLELLDEEIRPDLYNATVLVEAYRLLGNKDKAMETVQVSLYQYLMGMMAFTIQALTLYEQDEEKFEMMIQRALQMTEAFEVESLHGNAMAQLYFAAAIGYVKQEKEDKALGMLERYENVCVKSLLPFTLHGDDFFDLIDPWLQDFDLGVKAPREDKMIIDSMVSALEIQPLDPLKKNPRYKEIVKRMKRRTEI